MSDPRKERWLCMRCEYEALSRPVEGGEVHVCPMCGGQWWRPVRPMTYDEFEAAELA